MRKGFIDSLYCARIVLMVHVIRELYHHRYSLEEIKNNQLHELYLAMMLKTLGLSLIGVFVPVYLFKLGHGLETISLFYVIVYGVRIFSDYVAAWLTGYFGPKHMMIVSHIFLIISLAMLLTLKTYNWPLWYVAVITSIATGFFFVPYHIEFSKLQSSTHGGSQIGTMYRTGKIAAALGPMLGGIIATYAGVHVVIVIALLFIMMSAIPLMMGPEPVRKRQHITLRGFPWQKVRRDAVSNMALNVDQMTNMVGWPLYVAMFIFVDNAYLGVGTITSISLVVTIAMVGVYGKKIDSGKGWQLMRFGVAGSFLVNMSRVFIRGAAGVFGLSLIVDVLTSAVRMPYTKGLYSAASSHEGYRDAYFGVIFFTTNVARTSTFLVVYLLVLSTSDAKQALHVMFLLAAVTILGAMLSNFKALNNDR